MPMSFGLMGIRLELEVLSAPAQGAVPTGQGPLLGYFFSGGSLPFGTADSEFLAGILHPTMQVSFGWSQVPVEPVQNPAGTGPLLGLFTYGSSLPFGSADAELLAAAMFPLPQETYSWSYVPVVGTTPPAGSGPMIGRFVFGSSMPYGATTDEFLSGFMFPS